MFFLWKGLFKDTYDEAANNLPNFMKSLYCCATIALILISGLAASPEARADDAIALSIMPDHKDGLYSSGDTVTWTIDLADPKADRAKVGLLDYTVKKDGDGVVTKGQIDLSNGPATVMGSRTEPGALMLNVTKPGGNGLPIGVGGGMFDWQKVRLSQPAPADFDQFWGDKLKELAAVPVNPVLQKVDVPNATGTDYYKVTLDNIRGTHVQGQLARPTAGEKFPAVLVLQFAGVYPLKKDEVTNRAAKGWLALNISAHDLPIDESEDFYKQKKDGDLKNYVYLGSEDREQSYFLRMLLACVRAAEYLTSRPDWDGKTLIVTGTSQGGLQGFATAALFPKTSGLMVNVPAGCDVYGPKASPVRAFGWPYWLSNWGPRDRDLDKVSTTAGYFDAAYFAERVKCPSLVSVGLLDDTSRPFGVIAAFNAIQAPKELILMTRSNHHGSGGAQGLYLVESANWLAALQQGRPLPIAAEGFRIDPFK